jgi:indole-3-glycerol phosphate synthase
MGFLDEVVHGTRAAIGRADYFVGLPDPRARPTSPSLRRAVEGAGAGGALLVEYKRVSPGSSAPELPERSPEEFVDATRSAPIAGYSCIATVPRFRGSPLDVARVVAATPRPVLFKDFVVDRIQLDAAVRTGASAVLLIARLELEGRLGSPLAELASEAHARGLEVLLEFHDRSELSRAADVRADMYGVNVRDLDTLRMEPAVADDTLRAAQELRPLLGLSGVASTDDARRFWDGGVDGILVGSAVARAADPVALLRSLSRSRP